MKKTPIYAYFAFGYNYCLLRQGVKGAPVHGTDSLESRLGEFFQFVDDLNLQVTNQLATSLRLLLKKAKNLPVDAKVDERTGADVAEWVNALDKTLDAELQLRHAFIITPKRFSLEHLLDSPSGLLGGDVFSLLPPVSRSDFSDACRCIAYGCPTAAAFHLMRATEGTLRFYYSQVVKRGRVKSLMWGPMIDHLKKRRDCPCRPLVDHLDHIRVNFRNPTQHPDARYDLDSVQDLLAVSIDAINRMVRDLLERKLLHSAMF